MARKPKFTEDNIIWDKDIKTVQSEGRMPKFTEDNIIPNPAREQAALSTKPMPPRRAEVGLVMRPQMVTTVIPDVGEAKPKNTTRSLEEIRADIDKAQGQLDLINKTTVPFFEAKWHKESRQAAQDRVDALKSEWKETAGWDYDAYGDSTPGVTKAINKTLDVAGDAALSGVSQFTTGVANTADLVLGKPLEAAGWKNNPLRVGADIMNEYNAELAKQVQKSAGDSKAAQTAAQVLASTVAAAPMAVMAFLTGGASAATTASLEATAASQGASAVQMVGRSVSQMMKNPNYWTSFIQEAGNNFREAQEWAGNDEKAAVYALTVGLVNSGIEVGLDGASGIQGLERAVRQGNTSTLRQFLDSAGGEALEEIEQGVVSRGVGQLFGSGAKTFSTTDPDAVINPKTMLEEGAMGGAVGALLTGGTHVVNAAVQRASSNPLIQAYDMGRARQEAVEAPQNAQEAQWGRTATRRSENVVTPSVAGVAEVEGQAETAGQKNTAPDGAETAGAVIERFNPIIEAYNQAKGASEGGSRSVPTARVGSTGIDGAASQGHEVILSPGAELVNNVVEEALSKAKDRRADANEILSILIRQGDNPTIATQMARAYRGLTESGDYAVDGAGKLYKTGGENDLSINERQEDFYRLGKRNINAFQFDHPEVHKYYVEAAERLLSDFGMTTKGERFFNYVPDQSNPIVTGVKRNTSAPIVTMLDDLNMTYERAQDVLERIINDKGQENIADAKRVEMLLDDILKHGYESLSGPVEPNEGYIEALRQMGQIAPDELTDTGSRRRGGEIRTDAEGYAALDDYDEDDGEIPSLDRNLSAAERGFSDSPYNRWVENAERFHPEGENAARNPSLPTVNLDGLNTSKVGQTVMEAANTPEDRVVDIQNRYVKGGLTIASRTNEGLVREAITKLESDPDGTLKAWQDDVKKGKVSNDLVAMGAALLDSERIKSNGAVFMDVLTDYVKLCSTAGQALQAQRIYKALTPEGRLYMVKKVAQGISEETGVQMDFKADMVEDLLHAQSDEDMDAALDKIYDHLAAQIPSTFKDKWTALRYMNMLGNFKTQIRNLAGNSLMSGMKAVKNEVAAAIEAAVARVNPDMERTQSFHVGKAWMDAAKADFENVREAAQGNGRYDDSSRSAIEQEIQSRRRIFKTRPLELYRKATNWATNAGDDIFIKHHYARALAGYLKANGVRVEQFLEGNVDLQLLNRATDFAIREAQEATFHDNNAFSDWVSKLGRRQDTPKAARLIGEGVAPFRKTPANVLARAYEYSPAGLIDAAVETAKAVRGDGAASDVINSLARSLTGTGIMALGFALAAKGWIRGTGDEDDQEVDELMNRQDYSLVIPGKSSYTIDWVTPATMPLFMGANLWDIFDDGEISLEDMDSVLAKFTEPILETSMLSGINDAIANVKFSKNHMGQIAATYALSWVMQGLTNSFFGQLERTFEPNRMTTYTSGDNPMPDWLERTLGQASAKIPGIDFQQTEYRDELGKTESNGSLAERFIENLLSPGYWTPTHEGEPLYDSLQELHDQTGANPWPDAYPPNGFTVSGEKYTMGQADKEQYQQTRGSIYEDLAGQFFQGRKNLFTPEEAVDILTGIRSYAGAEAKKEFFEENGIDASVNDNYIAKAVLAVQEAKIPFVKYLDYYIKSGDLTYEKGVSGAKKAAVMELINSLDLSDKQKDWLYLNAGYSENSIGKAPWH